jgi:hypothetical protein
LQRIWLIIGLIAVCLAHARAHAEELPENYILARPLGMGGAFTAVADDHNSLWTNPAGIGRIRKQRSQKRVPFLAIPNLTAAANGQGRAFYRQFKTAQSTSASGSTTEDNIRAAIANSDASTLPAWAALGLNPVAFFEPKVASSIIYVGGVYSFSQLSAVPDPENTASIAVRTYTDMGVNLGLAINNQSNRFNFGIQARPVLRYSYEDAISPTLLVEPGRLSSAIQAQGNQTSGVALDAGLLMTLADFWFPTIGLSVLNLPIGCVEDYLNPNMRERQTICGTTFSGSIRDTESNYLLDPTDIRVGIAITPRILHNFAFRVAIDAHHLPVDMGNDSYIGLPGVSPAKMLHAGIEFFIGNPLDRSPFSVRAGVNQGFTTYGLSFRLKSLYVDVTSYGQDLSSDSKPREDRRILLNTGLEF